MSTYFPKGEIARKWYVIDASGQTLGTARDTCRPHSVGQE